MCLCIYAFKKIQNINIDINIYIYILMSIIFIHGWTYIHPLYAHIYIYIYIYLYVCKNTYAYCILLTYNLRYAYAIPCLHPPSRPRVKPPFRWLRRYCHPWRPQQLWPLNRVLFCLISCRVAPCLLFPLMT